MDIQSIVAQLRQEVNRFEQAIAALAGLGQTAPRRGRPPKLAQSATASHNGRRRTMSPAARAKIAAAKKKWWAKQGKATSTSKKVTPTKKASRRKGMSPAARKKLSALMKARWAQRKKSS